METPLLQFYPRRCCLSVVKQWVIALLPIVKYVWSSVVESGVRKKLRATTYSVITTRFISVFVSGFLRRRYSTCYLLAVDKRWFPYYVKCRQTVKLSSTTTRLLINCTSIYCTPHLKTQRYRSLHTFSVAHTCQRCLVSLAHSLAHFYVYKCFNCISSIIFTRVVIMRRRRMQERISDGGG